MIPKKLMTKKFLVGSVLGAVLSAAIISGCAVHTGLEAGRDSDHATVNQDLSEREGGRLRIGEHSRNREGNESSGEGNGEHGTGGDGNGTGSDGGAEINEAAMSSPITPLGQSWDGVLGGLAVSMQYDAATQSVHGTVRNTLSQRLCYVQAEPHLKSGTKTVGELGPGEAGTSEPWTGSNDKSLSRQ